MLGEISYVLPSSYLDNNRGHNISYLLTSKLIVDFKSVYAIKIIYHILNEAILKCEDTAKVFAHDCSPQSAVQQQIDLLHIPL